jgi:4-amino-4-deoxy-L-arabinose transferase-like glycosyltransferase
MKPALFFLILFIGLLASRLCHARILWVEESYPLAAASQMETGKALYRDIWFDKPPLLAVFYRLVGAPPGWPLRSADALYAALICILAYRFAGDVWGVAEARWAAALMAFFLTFDTPSAVIPIASDLLMVAPHLAAVYLAWRGRPFWSGVVAGIAFSVHPKGLFVVAACALWSYRSLPALASGFAAPNLAIAAWLWSTGSIGAYYEQVWKWGTIYAGSTFVEHPLRNAATRTAAWLGFHAAVLIGAIWFWRNERGKDRAKWVGWMVLSFVAVTVGWRFFPRYFFQLLPAMVLLGARGICLLPRVAGAGLISLVLLVPLVRFGPRYFQLAAAEQGWADTAMDRDSREAAALARSIAKPPDTLFVWGFRPEVYVYAGLPAASRFLDSQPLTGVPADRHLVDSTVLAPDLAAANRLELQRLQPTIILDGLGPYNPRLAITAYPDLAHWLSGYRVLGRTRATILYGKITPADRK